MSTWSSGMHSVGWSNGESTYHMPMRLHRASSVVPPLETTNSHLLVGNIQYVWGERKGYPLRKRCHGRLCCGPPVTYIPVLGGREEDPPHNRPRKRRSRPCRFTGLKHPHPALSGGTKIVRIMSCRHLGASSPSAQSRHTLDSSYPTNRSPGDVPTTPHPHGNAFPACKPGRGRTRTALPSWHGRH